VRYDERITSRRKSESWLERAPLGRMESKRSRRIGEILKNIKGMHGEEGSGVVKDVGTPFFFEVYLGKTPVLINEFGGIRKGEI